MRSLSVASAALLALCLFSTSYVASRLWWYSHLVGELQGKLAASQIELARERAWRAAQSAELFRQLEGSPANSTMYSYRPATMPALGVGGLGGRSRTQLGRQPHGSSGHLKHRHLAGQLTVVSAGRVEGWACVPATLGGELRVEVFVDGQPAGEVAPWGDGSAEPSSLCSGSGVLEAVGDWQRVRWAHPLPALAEGEHQVRAFARSCEACPGDELEGSPANFVETSSNPSVDAILRRKDELIRQKNLQLVQMYQDFHTADSWREALDEEDEPRQQRQNLTAFIGVHTTIDAVRRRTAARLSWFPVAERLAKLEAEHGVVVRFVVGKSETQADVAFAEMQAEAARFGDILILDASDRDSEQPAKMKKFLTAIPALYSAQLYFAVDDIMLVNLPELLGFIEAHHSQPNLYIGCFRSGEVVSNSSEPWYEPEWWRFGLPSNGSKPSYMMHAAGEVIGLSGNVARYLARNAPVLHTFRNVDTQLGAWLLGLNVKYANVPRLCCGTTCKPANGKGTCIAAKPKWLGPAYEHISYRKLRRACAESRASAEGATDTEQRIYSPLDALPDEPKGANTTAAANSDSPLKTIRS